MIVRIHNKQLELCFLYKINIIKRGDLFELV